MTSARLPRSVIAAAFVVGGVDLYCLAPTVHVHDAGELTAAAWTLGLGHPPGAPLYMLIASAFMHLVPYGHIAWRANLLSAVLAVALFVVLARWAARRGLSPTESITLAAAATLAPNLWSQSVMAEVYTLQALLLALVLTAVDLGAPTGRIALLWGLLLACHVGLVPLTPLLLALLVVRARGWRARVAEGFRLALLMAVPLLLYVYVPVRAMASHPVMCWGRPDSLRALWWYLSNQNVRARAFDLPVAAYLGRALQYGVILVRNSHLALGLAAVAVAVGRARSAVVLAAAVVVYDAAFVVLLDTAPLQSEAYATPAIVAISVLAGIGLTRLAWRRVATALLASAVVMGSWFAWGEVDLSRSFVVRDAAESILDQAGRGAVLFTQEDNTTFALAYLVAAEGARPDLEVFDRAGNLFRSPYDRPLHRVAGDLGSFRKASDDALVTEFLDEGRDVVFTAPFLEFEPDGWQLLADGTVGRATLSGGGFQSPHALPPPLRRSAHPDWMSRQVLAMDAVKRAASLLRLGDEVASKGLLVEASGFADTRDLRLRLAQLALVVPAADIAAEVAETVVSNHPGFAPALSVLAEARALQGRWGEAEIAARKATAGSPSLPQPWLVLGLAAAHAGRWAEADAHFTRALELGGDPAPALVNRALVRERLANRADALADFDAARAMDPTGHAAVLRLQLVSESGLHRQELTDEICGTVADLPVNQLPPADLTRVLLVGARAGAPRCVDEWLMGVTADNAEVDQIVAAYRAGVRGGRP